MAEAMPEGYGEPVTHEADFEAGYDEETGEYQLKISVPGLVVLTKVTTEGFDMLEPVMVSLPQAVMEVIEQIEETRDQIANTNTEETP